MTGTGIEGVPWTRVGGVPPGRDAEPAADVAADYEGEWTADVAAIIAGAPLPDAVGS